jgi:hypothetical protein
MMADQVQVIAPDEHRRRIHQLIDHALDAGDDRHERLRWLIMACREMGEPEFPDRGIVEDVLRDPASDSLDTVLSEEERVYTDRQLQVAVRAAMGRGVPTEAIRELVARFTGGPERGMTTIKSEHRGYFLAALREL